ncbi:MAG: hypothetical protein AB1411_10325 [Nitrospirota bacterium]
MSDDGLYPGVYKRFFERRDQAKGYDFQHAPQGSAEPPVVTFGEKLRWWTWDRWKRMKKIRAERDRCQMEIIQLSQRSPHNK